MDIKNGVEVDFENLKMKICSKAYRTMLSEFIIN